MRAVHPDTGISIDVRLCAPGCRQETDGEAERLARLLTGDNGAHAVSYGTEAGHFQNQGGYSVCVCGPGSIDQATRRTNMSPSPSLQPARRSCAG